MTDYKQLCSELLTVIDSYETDSNIQGVYDDLAAKGNNVFDRARAALAEPEPEGPTLDDIYELCEEHEFILADGFSEEESIHVLWEIARAVLARWGRPAPQPMPVSERLPGPEDCDAQGRCWHFASAEGFGAAGWSFYQGSEDDTHWLPAHALPLPNNTSRSI